MFIEFHKVSVGSTLVLTRKDNLGTYTKINNKSVKNQKDEVVDVSMLEQVYWLKESKTKNSKMKSL